MATPKFEIFKGRNDQFYFRFRGGNNEIVAQSEGYTTKANAENGIAVIKREANDAPIHDLTENQSVT